MVRALAPLLNESDIPLGVASGEADALPEIFFGNGMGAGAGDEKPFRLEQFHA